MGNSMSNVGGVNHEDLTESWRAIAAFGKKGKKVAGKITLESPNLLRVL